MGAQATAAAGRRGRRSYHGRMTSIVLLRVRTHGGEAMRLLDRVEDELGVTAQPQTAGFVPISIAARDYQEAIATVTRVLEEGDPDWREHLELRV